MNMNISMLNVAKNKKDITYHIIKLKTKERAEGK